MGVISKFVAGKAVHKIILLQTRGGFEKDVTKKINFFLKKRGVKKVYFYEAFGSYDLIVIYEQPNDEVKMYEGTIDGIVSALEFDAFQYGDDPRLNKKKIDMALERAFVTLTFYKVSTAAHRKDGVIPDLTLWRDLPKIPATNAVTFGTLSWSEVVLLHSSDSLEAAVEQGVNLQSEIFFSDHGKKIHDPILKTFTILGLKRNSSNWKIDIQRSIGRKPKSEFKKAVRAKLLISCEVAAMKEVLAAARGLFKKFEPRVATIFGGYDISINIELKSARKVFLLIEKLLEFRKKHQGILLSTSTNFEIEKESGPQPGKHKKAKKAVAVELVRLSAEEVEFLLERYESVGKLLTASIYSFDNLLQQSVLRPCVFDVAWPILALKRSALDTKKPSQSIINHVATSLSCIQIAVEQRLHGVSFGMESFVASTVPFKAGIQKRLLALEAIPQFIFGQNSIPPRWTGLIFVGTDRSVMNHVGSYISIPLHYLDSPEKLWSLTHETMHSFGYEFDQSKLRKSGGAGSNQLSVSDSYFYSEVYAECMDFFRFSFVGIRNYSRMYWRHLKENVGLENMEKIRGYLTRNFIVFCFNEIHIKKSVKGNNFESAKELLDSFVGMVMGVAKIEGIPQITQNELEELGDELMIKLEGLSFELDFIYKQATNEFGSSMQSRKSWYQGKELRKILKELNQGRIILDPNSILFPDILLWAMKLDYLAGRWKNSVQSRTAFFMSLLHYRYCHPNAIESELLK